MKARAKIAAGARLLAVLAPAALATDAARPADGFDVAAWRSAFARPEHIPTPRDNKATKEKIALGAKLFEDTRLSGAGDLACATCHQPDLSFSDGISRHDGADGMPLDRRTPSLWNVAWALTLFWDGRVRSLEEQAAGPIENKREMGGDLNHASRTLAKDPAMRRAFAAAFPEDPQVSRANLAKAIAAFERTLVSPRTRFDRWVDGDDAVLSPEEKAGLRLFAGKAGCVNCHRGWRFSDDAFHDIGLPGTDRGRGEVLGLSAADHAFKTPSLRERVWTAPYMHDGSIPSLERVVDHYADGIVERPTLSADLPRIALDPSERAAIVAFLNTLSSEDPPRPASLPARSITIGPVAAIAATTVGQRDRRFTPAAVRLPAGASLKIVNDDTRVHNVRIDGPGLNFSSDAQNPGDTVTIGFPQAGRYDAICGIHPQMHMTIDVVGRR